MPNPNCPECKGTGKYHGLNEISDCKTCRADAATMPTGYIPAGPTGRHTIPSATSNDFDDFLMMKDSEVQ